MGGYWVVNEAERKRRFPNIVPGKADDKADCIAVEGKPPDRHIPAMNTKRNEEPRPAAPAGTQDNAADEAAATVPKQPREIGGPKGPEPTRYGDWEFNGRCTDF